MPIPSLWTGNPPGAPRKGPPTRSPAIQALTSRRSWRRCVAVAAVEVLEKMGAFGRPRGSHAMMGGAGLNTHLELPRRPSLPRRPRNRAPDVPFQLALARRHRADDQVVVVADEEDGVAHVERGVGRDVHHPAGL